MQSIYCELYVVFAGEVGAVDAGLGGLAQEGPHHEQVGKRAAHTPSTTPCLHPHYLWGQIQDEGWAGTGTGG